MLPSPSDLTYFVEVAQTQNLSRAAERLGLSQPSLSLAIQRLEHAVGVRLLVRGKKGVSLTQPGRQLLAHARQLLQSWDQVKAQTLASERQVQGSYRIGCHASVALYSLPRFLPKLLDQYPGLNLTLNHDLSRKIAEGVISTEIDIGIVVNPVRHPDLILRKVCEDEVAFWTGPGGRKIQDLRSGQAVLLCDPALAQSQSLLKQLKKQGLSIDRVVSSTSLEVIAELAARGAGVGILPSRVAALSPKLKRVAGAPTFRDEIHVVYRAENREVKTIQVLFEAIRDVLNSTA